MSSWHGNTSGCAWSWFYGDTSNDDWSAYLHHLETTYSARNPNAVLLTVAYKNERPNAAQRAALADLSKRLDLNSVKAHAFATDSPLTRGVLTAINWVIKKPFPERIFDNVPSGLLWLERSAGGPHAGDLLQALAAAVPQEAYWHPRHEDRSSSSL